MKGFGRERPRGSERILRVAPEVEGENLWREEQKLVDVEVDAVEVGLPSKLGSLLADKE